MSIKEIWTNMKTWQKIAAVAVAILVVFSAVFVVKAIVLALVKSIAFWLIVILAGAIVFYAKKNKIKPTE